MRKFNFVMIALFILFVGGNVSSYGSNDVTVYLNGKLIKFDTAPRIEGGRTMVPLRNIFEALDMTVSWDGVQNKVTAEKKGMTIALYIGSDEAMVNGKIVKIDAKAYTTGGRTMVPLRFIGESTGATVQWDGNTKRVTLFSNGSVTNTNDTSAFAPQYSYKIVDTGVTKFYTDRSVVSKISAGTAFYGQDANYTSNQPNYTDNHNGTVTDNVTGLMWQQTMAAKMTYNEAVSYANASHLGGFDDWRLPTIKELFSLILFTGESGGEAAKVFFIDTDYFNQPIGNTSIGEREIDAQVWSGTKYVGKTMNGDAAIFGVNFVDGRIKGYSLLNPRTHADNKGYFRLVRGNVSYGKNMFVDNGDGTISDIATGLMWQKSDDGQKRDWKDALGYAEDIKLAGHDDWRLPNVKELQSIIDYTRSPQTTGTPAISGLFVLSEMKDPAGNKNYGFYWSGTTHQDGFNIADSASYVAFGEAQGQMHGRLMDVHGAGAVRSDPKSGSTTNYPDYHGPQGDIRYVYNFVLAVRDIQ